MVSFYRYCYDTCEYALKIQKKQKPFSLWGPQAAIYRRGFKISNSVNEPWLDENELHSSSIIDALTKIAAVSGQQMCC